MVRPLDVISLPLRAAVLLLLWGMAYYCGYGTIRQESRTDSTDRGIVARYTRNGRAWRTLCDRDRNGKWDIWIDERAGRPFIVSIDDDGDGKPDREEDETGTPLTSQRAARLRAYKTLIEFLHNRSQLAYIGLSTILYGALELMARSLLHPRLEQKRNNY